VTFSARDWVDSFDGSVPHLLADHVVERADNVAFANVPAPLAVVRGVVLKYSVDAPPVDLMGMPGLVGHETWSWSFVVVDEDLRARRSYRWGLRLRRLQSSVV
jgi:hypothetical protein